MGINNLWQYVYHQSTHSIQREVTRAMDRLSRQPDQDNEFARETMFHQYVTDAVFPRLKRMTREPARRILVAVDGNLFLHKNCMYIEEFQIRKAGGNPVYREGIEMNTTDGSVVEPYVLVRCSHRQNNETEGEEAEREQGGGAAEQEGEEGGGGGGGGTAERCTTHDAYFKTVFSDIFNKVRHVVQHVRRVEEPVVDLVVCFDGVTPCLKWDAQLGSGRRLKDVRAAKSLEEAYEMGCSLTAFCDIISHMQDYVREVVLDAHSTEFAVELGDLVDTLTVVPPSYVGEGEFKVTEAMRLATRKASGGDDDETTDVAIAITDDSDALLYLAAALQQVNAKDVYVYTSVQKAMCELMCSNYHMAVYGGDLSMRFDAVPGTHMYQGFVHVRDDFFGRFLQNASPSVNPMTYCVPLLMLGGLEMTPILLTKFDPRNDKTQRKALFRSVLRGCVHEATAVEQNDFFALLRKALSMNAAHTSVRSVTNRRKNSWTGTDEQLHDACVAYIRLLYWCCHYVTGSEMIKWYGDFSELQHAMMMSAQRTALISVSDVLKVLSDYMDQDLTDTLLPRQCLLMATRDVAVDSGRMTESSSANQEDSEGDMIERSRYLCGMFMMKVRSAYRRVSSDDSSSSSSGPPQHALGVLQEWYDSDQVKAVAEKYAKQSLCKMRRWDTLDPRAFYSIRQMSAGSDLNIAELAGRMFESTAERLRHIDFFPPPRIGGGAESPAAVGGGTAAPAASARRRFPGTPLVGQLSKRARVSDRPHELSTDDDE